MTRTPRAIGRAGLAAASAAIVSVIALVLTAQTAAATNPPIAISGDGVTYADAYTGQLFQGVLLVPNGSATRSFWVKNTGTSGANLALTVIDVASVDPALLSALTLTAHVGGHSGSVRLADVHSCELLVHGVPLAREGDVRVDVTLSMANVGGTTAQNTQAEFNLRINLTSDDVPAPRVCTYGVDPTPSPDPSGTPGAHSPDGGGTVVVPGTPSAPTEPSAPPIASPTPNPTATPSPEPSASPSPDPTDPEIRGVKGNTDRFYQEWFIAAWVIEAMLGGYLAWRAWRKRQNEGVQS